MSRKVSVSRVWLTRLSPLKPAEIFMNADEAERPCPRRSELCQRRQCQREELSSHDLKASIRRTTYAHAQRPERTSLTILRPLIIEPTAIETQMVVEALHFDIESVV